MRLRELAAFAALFALIALAYAYVGHADEQSAQRELAAWTGRVDK